MKMRILHRSVIPGCVYITAEILNQLVKLLKDFLNGGQTAFEKYSAICIGTPGKISAETGNFIFAPKFVNYKSVNLHKDLFRRVRYAYRHQKRYQTRADGRKLFRLRRR